MSDQTDLFGQQTHGQNVDYLQELVGEGKKFKDVSALAKGKFEADQTVEVLKSRLDEMREDFLRLKEESEGRARLEDLVDQLSRQSTSSETNTTNANGDSRPQLDPDKVKSLIVDTLQQTREQEKQQENFNTVMDTLKERYGDSYQNVLKERVEELGLTPEYVNEQARKFPKALMRTLGLDQPVQQDVFQAPPRSNQRGDFSPTVPKRTWSYYQKMKKENPRLYWEPKTTNQMMEDMKTLGDAFKDGDWSAI